MVENLLMCLTNSHVKIDAEKINSEGHDNANVIPSFFEFQYMFLKKKYFLLNVFINYPLIKNTST